MFATFAIAAASLASPFSNFQVEKVEASLCNPCVQIGEQGINLLLNEILNAGIVGGCSKLCSLVPSRLGALACDVLCDSVGVKEFIKVLNSTDIDPIYFCEELGACPAGKDDAAGTVDGTAVSPAAAPVGTEFDIQLRFSVINATGVGEIRLAIEGGQQHIAQSFVNTGFLPGPYATNITFTPQNDEKAQPPVFWSPGTYTYEFVVCQGECGSKHPHSKVFGKTVGSFQITSQ